MIVNDYHYHQRLLVLRFNSLFQQRIQFLRSISTKNSCLRPCGPPGLRPFVFFYFLHFVSQKRFIIWVYEENEQKGWILFDWIRFSLVVVLLYDGIFRFEYFIGQRFTFFASKLYDYKKINNFCLHLKLSHIKNHLLKENRRRHVIDTIRKSKSRKQHYIYFVFDL